MAHKPVNSEQIVDAIYDTAMSPQKFERLIQVWDKEFRHTSFDSFEQNLDEATQSLLKHFERADQIFLSTQNTEEQSTHNIVENEPTSAFICDSRGKIHAANQAAKANLAIAEGDNISALPLEAKAHAALSHILSAHHQSLAPSTNNAIRGVNTSNNKVFVLVAQRLFNVVGYSEQEPLFLFKSSLAIWHRGIELILASAFDLTKAEIEIVEALSNGLSLKEIAEQRLRSLDTIRTQMKNVLLKTETQNQANLMRHVTSLLLLASTLDDKQLALKNQILDTSLSTIKCKQGRKIQFRFYGAQGAPCILCIFPILASQLSSPLVKSFLQKGLSLLVVEESENQVLSFMSKPDIYIDMLSRHVAVLDHLNISQVDVMGLCAGGIYAVEFANRYPERTKRVICVDTGAPLTDKVQWDKISPHARRTFAVARKFPSLLLMPHRLAAHLFFKAKDGKQQLINYVYGDCQSDIDLINRDNIVRDWSLGMLTYCFSDVKRPIRACEMWVQNWYPSLQKALNHTEVYFIHGDKNPQFYIDDLYRLEKAHLRLKVIPAHGVSQLTLISHRELVADSIATLNG